MWWRHLNNRSRASNPSDILPPVQVLAREKSKKAILRFDGFGASRVMRHGMLLQTYRLISRWEL